MKGAPVFFFSSRRRHTRCSRDWSSDVCSSDLLGHSAFTLFADFPQAMADVRRALTGETFSSPVEVFGAVFEAWYSPVRDADGAVAGVIGVGTDITERCRAETGLRHSEESHRALVQHASYAIYRSSVEGRFLTVNPA